MPTLATEDAVFEYALLHNGLMRNIISRIGQEAGIAADYWKGGVYVYEMGTGSRGRIEEERNDDIGRGRIRVRTQRGQAALLLQRLQALIEEEQNRAGMTPVEVTSTITAYPATGIAGERTAAEAGGAAQASSLFFGQEPSPQPEYCVSYAWGDDTPQGRDREMVVDRLCTAAKVRGIRIVRDKTDLGLGEQISKFMQRIGRADRVFVVLSDKYLKSSFCMFELWEVWRTSRLEDEQFRHRIRVWTLPCARIWAALDRAEYAIHWKKRHDELAALVKEHGYDIIGEKDSLQLRRMRDFSRNVGDILATVADTLQPRDFAELEQYGFGE